MITRTTIPIALFIVAVLIVANYLNDYRQTADACFQSDACIAQTTP